MRAGIFEFHSIYNSVSIRSTDPQSSSPVSTHSAFAICPEFLLKVELKQLQPPNRCLPPGRLPSKTHIGTFLKLALGWIP